VVAAVIPFAAQRLGNLGQQGWTPLEAADVIDCFGSRSSGFPKAYIARRVIAFPATMFSPIANLSNDAIVPGP
jgi:hypothetical protein